MRKLTGPLALIILASLGSAAPLNAQKGPGGFLDWIHRLSGPSMLGPAASYFVTASNSVRFRATVSGRWAVGFKDPQIQDGHGINMLGFQPTVEIPVSGPLEVGGGFALNRMGGEGHDAVYHFSIPIFGQVRFPLSAGGKTYLRIGLGAHYFPAFDTEDFVGPGEGSPGIQVETGSGEFSFGLFFGLDRIR